MKTYFIQNYNNVLTDLIEYIQNSTKYRTTNKLIEADVVILWSDVGEWDRQVIRSARAMRKKVFVLQHGRKGTSRYYAPFNEPITADKLLVWGYGDKENLIKHGHPKKKIEIVGTTLFSHLKPREKHEGINIVFSPEHWDKEVEENKIVASWLKRIGHHLNIVTKIIPGHDARLYQNPIFSDRNEPNHLEVVANTLKTADIVVGISESTFELMAEYLDIPVIIADIWKPKACNGDERYKTYQRTYSNAVTRVKTESEFQEALKEYIENPALLREERKKVCESEGGTNIKDPIWEIMKWIS